MSSVIERLRIAERLARQASRAVDVDAAALVRTWPRVAASAYEACRSIPATGHVDELAVERITLDAQSSAETIQRQPWPGSGVRDVALLQVAAAFERAVGDARSPMPAADVDEAHRLINSSLWITSRLVGRSTRDHAFDIRLDRKNFDDSRAHAALLATNTHRRFNAVEQLSAGALRIHSSPDAGGVAGQLRRAVGTWDVEAHRALLTNRSTLVLHVLAHQEAASVKAFTLFVDEAADSGIIDPFTAARLRPVLDDTAASWTQLRDVAAELSFGHTALPTTLIYAAADLRERFQDAIGAGPQEHGEILGALSSHLASAVTISAAGRDLIANGELRAPARAIARVAAKEPGIIASPVDPVAIHRGLSVPLTEQARLLLDAPTSRVFLDADEALNRAAGLDTLYRLPPPGVQPADTPFPRHAPPPAMNTDAQLPEGIVR